MNFNKNACCVNGVPKTYYFIIHRFLWERVVSGSEVITIGLQKRKCILRRWDREEHGNKGRVLYRIT